MAERYPAVLEHVTFSYEGADRPVLDDVSLRINRGEVTAILGSTGAGKTTVAYALGGVIPNYIRGELKGEVIVEGLNTKDHSLHEIAQHVGLVMDDPEAHIVSFTVWEDAAFGPCNLGLPVEEVYDRVNFALGATRLDGMRMRNPYKLSGGEKQSLAVAGVLSMRPSVLVLDEPISMLDPLGRERVRSVLKDLNEKYGMTFIFSDYDAERVVGIADRLVIVDEGRIVLDGECHEVLQQTEVLEEAGVHLPESTQLAARLRQDGFWKGDLPATIEEATSFLASELSVGQYVRAKGEETHDRVREAVVSIHNLHHEYAGGVQALRGVDIDIYAKEYVALIGQNGSGKTTLAKHISGLLKPTNRGARISVAGLDITQAGMREVATKVGYIFQIPEHQLFCSTVSEELRFGLKNLGISEDESEARVAEVSRELGLHGIEGELLMSLNRGKRFRVVLASVVAMDPEVVIVDEPTTGQDWRDSLYVCGFLERLRRAGKTIIMITHEMNLVATFATRIIVMYQGRVLLDGSPRAVFSKPDILRQTWVQPPAMTRLSSALSEYGMPSDLLTVPEVYDALMRLHRRAG